MPELSIPPEIERAKQVFRFLKAFAERNLPVQRRLTDQPWSMVIAELPKHPSIVIGEVQFSASGGGDNESDETSDATPLLRVRRPALTRAPRPPAEIADWLQPGWEDPSGRVEPVRERNELRRGETVTVLVDQVPARVAALEQYRVAWNRWAEAERPARAAMRVFERLYKLKGKIDLESERLELVLGDGRLRWGALKVIMTGDAAEGPRVARHARNKPRREALAKRVRDARDPLRVVIVRDMWLTGFDAPCPPHHVRGQADARAWPHAGHRQGQPSLPRQAGRAHGGLSRPGARVEGRARHLHRERWHRQDGDRPGGGSGGHAREARGLLRPVPRGRPVEVGDRLRHGTPVAPAGRPGAHPRATRRQAAPPPGRARAVPGLRPGRAARASRRCRSGTTSRSFRRCAPAWPSVRPARPGRPRTWITPSGRSSREQSSPRASWTSPPRRD